MAYKQHEYSLNIPDGRLINCPILDRILKHTYMHALCFMQLRILCLYLFGGVLTPHNSLLALFGVLID